MLCLRHDHVVCSQLELCLDTETLTLADLVDRVFKRRLGFVNPTVTIGKSTIVHEEGEDADERLAVNLTKLLKVILHTTK